MVNWHELGLIKDKRLTKDTKLYRYVNLSQFLSFVENKKIILNNINSWEDTWEVPANKIPTQLGDDEIKFPSWSKFDDMFGMCWSLECDSDALWRIYSQNKEGILLGTSVKKFELLCHRIKFGVLSPVIYYNDILQTFKEIKKVNWPKNFFIDGLLKRKSFEHEKEVRLVTLNDERCLDNKIRNCEYIEIEVDPIEFIDSITIDPRASDWYVESITKYCKRAGFDIRPTKSDLYSDVYKKTGIIIKYTRVEKS